MSTKDSDFKRKVEQAATIQRAASFLKIPQAISEAGFMDEDSKSAAKQMQVRRARDAIQIGGPAGDFPANIFEPGKISEKVSRANNNKKQAETSGPRSDGGERFRP